MGVEAAEAHARFQLAEQTTATDDTSRGGDPDARDQEAAELPFGRRTCRRRGVVRR